MESTVTRILQGLYITAVTHMRSAGALVQAQPAGVTGVARHTDENGPHERLSL